MGAPLSPEQRRQVEALDHVTLFESHYKLEWMSDPWPDVEAASHWLLDIESQFKPDLIHLNGYAHGSLPWRSPVIIVAHSCVLSWWQAVKREPAPPQWHRYRAAVRDGLRSADVVVAPSAAMLQSIQELYGPLPATQVIPNARDASLFRPAKKDPFILSAGRLWDEAKNVAALARIAPDLHWPVSVAGEGGESLPSNIRWLGRLDQSQMAGILSRAALYALPARYEPFGLSVLEAALSGCALVLGDIPSLRENWSGAARFVDPGDHRQLLHALNDLIRDHHARAALSAAALSRASRFSTDRLASVYLTAYQHLARSPQPADLPPVERISVCGS
jgi:glycosyltransferase involved in cell wall biosynthesis